MNKKINIAIIALLTFGAGAVSAETNDDMVVCTADAMVCPDGTSVGRTGPNCEFVCGEAITTGNVASNIPAFTTEDKMRGWYYGDKKQMKPGTPAGWLVRNAGTRSAQWYNPGLTSTKPINTPNLQQKQSIGIPMIPRPEIRKDGVSGREEMGKAARPGATTTNAMKANREEMEARAKALRASTTVATQKIKDGSLKKRIDVARKQTELVNKRLEQAIERVQKLSDRVAEGLTKLEADGVTTTVSRGYIAEAKIKLDEARAKVATVKLATETALATATSNETASTTPATAPKDVLKGVQDAVKEATKVIKDAHSSVAKAISSIKPGTNKPRPATTTPTPAPATTETTTTQ